MQTNVQQMCSSFVIDREPYFNCTVVIETQTDREEERQTERQTDGGRETDGERDRQTRLTCDLCL